MDATAQRVGVADILRRFGPTYRATHALSATRTKVWRALVACRTAALGGHLETCDTCGSMRLVYHSCRNRHCPLCQTRAKEAWLAQRQRELLPVPYFHLVFTLPHDLNWLIEQQPRAIYEALFAAVSATLTEFAANPRWLGGTPAFSPILHTWKPDLGRHVHLHAPRGRWRARSKPPQQPPLDSQHPRIRPERIGNPVHPRQYRLRHRRANLTFPIVAIPVAVQSNEVYPPPRPLRAIWISRAADKRYSLGLRATYELGNASSDRTVGHGGNWNTFTRLSGGPDP